MRTVLVVNLPAAVDCLVSLVGHALPALHVMTAGTGREALELTRGHAASHPIDLAIVNSDLADLTWRELAHDLARMTPETPIVVCPSLAEEACADRIERLGHRVLWQPIEERNLRDVVSRYVSPAGS